MSSYTHCMPTADHELVSLRRSAAMIQPHQMLPINRQVVMEMCDELIESRQLLNRLGSDLRTVAAKSRPTG